MAHIIFVPGIMGSELIKNEKQKWPVLFEQQYREISMDNFPEILDTKPLLKYFKSFYSVIVERFEEKYGDNFHAFSYDWRHDLMTDDTFVRLSGKIDEKDDEVIFVAHSMGGLLVKLFVQWCIDNKNDAYKKISKVITIATPWKGSPEAMWRLRYGEPHPSSLIRLTSAQASKDVAQTMPSVYQLLPHNKFVEQNEFVYDPHLNRYLRSDEIAEQMLSGYQRYMFKTFEVTLVQKFLSRDWPEEITPYAVIGHRKGTADTIVKALKDEKGNILEKEKMLLSSGDITVPVIYAEPYDLRTVKKYVKDSHQEIVKNEHVLSWVESIIEGNEYQSNELSDHPSYEFSAKVLKVACPVDVSMYKNDTLIGGEASNLNELKDQIDWLLNYEEETKDTELFDNIKIMGDTTYFVSDDENPFEFKIEGKDEGIASVELSQYIEGEVKKINAVPALKVTKGSIATLTIDNSNDISVTTDKQGRTVKSESIEVNADRKEIKPVTRVKYEVENGNELVANDTLIIQSPIKFLIEVTGINKEEYLETRLIANGKKYAFRDEYIYIPEPGPNEIIIYSVSKYGTVQEEPFVMHFIYDCEPPHTVVTSIMFADRIQLYLKGKDDSLASTKTYYKFDDDDDAEFKEITSSGLSIAYTGSTLEYYSEDIVGNKEEIKYLVIPNEAIRKQAFENKFKKYEEIIKALSINENDIEKVIRNSRSISNFKMKITENPTNISISMLNGDLFSFVFGVDFDVLWTQHPTEVLNSDDKELKPFRFSLVTRNGFIKGKNVKVKIVPKSKSSLLKDGAALDVKFLEESLEYEGYFGVSVIPKAIPEGTLQVFIGNKMYREAKFRIM